MASSDGSYNNSDSDTTDSDSPNHPTSNSASSPPSPTCQHLPFSHEHTTICESETPDRKGYLQEHLKLLLNIDTPTLQALMKTLEHPTHAVCHDAASCMTTRFFCRAFADKSEACAMLSSLLFPAPVVRTVLQRNGDDLPRLAFLMYHVYLASKKRVLAREAYRRKTAALRERGRVERGREDGLPGSLDGGGIPGDVASLILLRLKESELQVAQLAGRIEAVKEASDVSGKKVQQQLEAHEKHVQQKLESHGNKIQQQLESHGNQVQHQLQSHEKQVQDQLESREKNVQHQLESHEKTVQQQLELHEKKHKASDKNHKISDKKHKTWDKKHKISDTKHKLSDTKHKTWDKKHNISDTKHEKHEKDMLLLGHHMQGLRTDTRDNAVDTKKILGLMMARE